MRLFIGGLSYTTSEDTLRSAFAQYGEVTAAQVVTDRDTGRSKGFGFVDFVSDTDAQTALEAMTGQRLDGRTITVERAKPKAPARSFSQRGPRW